MASKKGHYSIGGEGGGGASTLDGLSDVTLTSPSNGEVLKYNGSAWVNDSIAGTGDVVGPASATDGHVVLFDGTSGTLIKSGGKGIPTGDIVGTSDTQTLTNKTLTTPTITLKQGASPTPTAEGAIEWDTDDNQIKIGDGSGTKVFSDDSKVALVANNLSDLASAETARDNLGVEIGVDVQAYDANLTTWAGKTAPSGTVVGNSDTQTLTNKTLTTPTITLKQSATPAPTAEGAIEWDTDDNVIAVGDGTSTKTFVDSTKTLLVANDLSDLNDASTARTNLGLVIGTNVQAYDADLTTWAGKTAPSGTVVGDTDTQTLTNKTLTSPRVGTAITDTNGNEIILTPATASAVNEITMTNAATGGSPTISASGGDTNIDLTLTGKGTGKVKIDAQYGVLTADSDDTTITFNMATSNKHTVTLGGNRTLAVSNVSVGQVFLIRLVQDGTGSRTVTWFSTIKWAGGAAPTLTTTLNKADLFGFLCTSSGNYDGFIIGQNI